MSKKKLLRKC